MPYKVVAFIAHPVKLSRVVSPAKNSSRLFIDRKKRIKHGPQKNAQNDDQDGS